MAIDPTPIVEVDVFTATVPKPEVGTPVLAEDVTAGLQALANRTKHLGNLASIVNIFEFAYGDDAAVAPFFTRSNVNYGDSTVLILCPALKIGDVLLIDTSMFLSTDATTGNDALFRMAIDTPGGRVHPVGCTARLVGNTTGGDHGSFSHTTEYSVIANGDHQIIYEAKSANNSINVFYSAIIRAVLARLGSA